MRIGTVGGQVSVLRRLDGGVHLTAEQARTSGLLGPWIRGLRLGCPRASTPIEGEEGRGALHAVERHRRGIMFKEHDS